MQLFAELARIVYSNTSFDEPNSPRVTSTVFGYLLPVVTGQYIYFEAALDEYIKYYNNDRIKLRFDGKSSAQYRALQISNH